MSKIIVNEKHKPKEQNKKKLSGTFSGMGDLQEPALVDFAKFSE